MRILGQDIIKQGGDIIPLVLPVEELKAPASANVSCLSINGKLLVNIRNLNYVLYHAEKLKNSHAFGPLAYLHPETDQTLTTYNYICELDDNLNISAYSLVDTTESDVPPKWEFVGLEDVRLVHWDGELWQVGVRRDTTPNGVGRMEMVKLGVEGNKVKELSRDRMPAPPPNDSYCEKNWMPILDIPYHFVKWTNPTEVVKYDINNKTTETVKVSPQANIQTNDLRGGSQVIPYKNHYICITHEVDLYWSEAGRKDADYWHRVIVWDKDFNIVHASEPFTFMNGKIEFCVGLTLHNNEFIATFGYQDNAAYLAKIPTQIMDGLTGL